MQEHEKDQQAELEAGTALKCKALIGTGIGGSLSTIIALAHFGPAGLFFGTLGTAAALALEKHGEPGEYAFLRRNLAPYTQRVKEALARQRALPHVQVNEQGSMPTPAFPYDFDAEDTLAAPIVPPSGPLYFSEVLKSFVPSLEKIYLGTLPDGRMLFIKARDLCHTALAGATRGGKDHLIRVLMAQLCYAGAKVYLLNPNYTRYDLETVDPYGRPCPEDWTPFDAFLKNDPREMIPRERKWHVIEHYLQAASVKVEERLEQYGYSEAPLGAPQFLFVNELPAIVEEVPDTMRYLKKILREGAKVGVFLVNASQDYQVSTLFKDMGGGVRKCYRTAFDVGSDPATQRALGLPVAQGLGKGKVNLRCDDVCSEIRAPYADNEALYRLLGPSTYTGGKQPRVQDEDLSEPRTDLPQGERRYGLSTGYEASRQRRAYNRDLHSYQRQAQQAKASVQASPEDGLRDDERQVLEAYRAGHKSGMAIKTYLAQQNLPMIGGTRINECLHRLASLGLVDWRPMKK